MSRRYKGAIISATPPTTSVTSAPGVWTLQQQMQAQAAGTWPFGGPTYIEDVFSTYLYTGTGASLTITNNVNLSSYGGLVWTKARSAALTGGHYLTDTVRGAGNLLRTQVTNGNENDPTALSAFGSTGFTLGASGGSNNSGTTFASWTFREQPKFFDVVTFTSDASNTNQRISHNLGSTPGCIFVKQTSGADGWFVWHRSYASATNNYQFLNTTAAVSTSANIWGSTGPSSTDFGINTTVFGGSATFVAYIFAHNAGGFGLTGTDNVISCGSWTASSTVAVDVTLGYEPQFVLIKRASGGTQNWLMWDTMRGWPVDTPQPYLNPNLSAAESLDTYYLSPTATGFTVRANALGNNGDTYIYVAIRRGPMAVPTVGTSVFSPIASSDTTATQLTTGFPVDMQWSRDRNNNSNTHVIDKLRGASSNATEDSQLIDTNLTAAESYSSGLSRFWGNTGYQVPSTYGATPDNVIYWNFRRAPGFFDEVCYVGNQTVRAITHNLGIAPELFLLFQRSPAVDIYARLANPALLGSDKWLYVNQTDAVQTSTNIWANTAPTASTFTVGNSTASNITGTTYVAYLFATCAGVSKVGSYTGNGSTQTINCGFGAAGARFVLIKRTDSTGDWYVYDTARGMTVLTDPYLRLNNVAAETATLGSVTTVSTGFALNSAILAAINVNAGTYIFLAIA